MVGVNSATLIAHGTQNVNFAVASTHVLDLLKQREGLASTPLATPPAPERSAVPVPAWSPPEGQPRCVSPEEPPWPWPERVPIYELTAVTEGAAGVCRYGPAGADGVHVVFARFGNVDARDAQLDAAWVALEMQRTPDDDPCQRAGQVALDGHPVDVKTARNRDVLYVWMRRAAGDGPSGDALCKLAERLRVAAGPGSSPM